jgi:tripartite-type tricarboxylate transporter receptor subunit TctC
MNQFRQTVVLSLLVVMLVLSLGVTGVNGQSKYPTKPINLIVAYPPGGGADIAARLIASYVERKWGQRINVINKPGGNGIPAVLDVYFDGRYHHIVHYASYCYEGSTLQGHGSFHAGHLGSTAHGILCPPLLSFKVLEGCGS